MPEQGIGTGTVHVHIDDRGRLSGGSIDDGETTASAIVGVRREGQGAGRRDRREIVDQQIGTAPPPPNTSTHTTPTTGGT